MMLERWHGSDFGPNAQDKHLLMGKSLRDSHSHIIIDNREMAVR
jgi:hypothetical protein